MKPKHCNRCNVRLTTADDTIALARQKGICSSCAMSTRTFIDALFPAHEPADDPMYWTGNEAPVAGTEGAKRGMTEGRLAILIFGIVLAVILGCFYLLHVGAVATTNK